GKYNFGILKIDNNALNNSSNNNLPPNNIVRSHEPSHNTYNSNSDSSIRTIQEIFIRMSGKRGQIQSKQAAQPSSSYNESRTCHASCSIERHNESRNESRTCYISCSIEHVQNEPNNRYQINKVQDEPNNRHQIDNYRRQVDELLFKQNRQLYLLVRKLGDDIREIKDELKYLRRDPKKDLSAKNVYTNIIKRLFPNHLYPSQRELKETIKEYMNENFPEFVKNIGEVEFTNRFHNTWCAQLLIKMKNYCGAASQNVCSSIWKVFGCEKLPPLNNNAITTEIVKWKESEQVAQCF
ncbi:6087_t:CDS:2, partial [Gigaspora margarita]